MKTATALATVLVVATTLSGRPAELNEAVEQSAVAYRECIWGAVVRAIIVEPDPTLAVERSFQACATEEEALHWLLINSHISETHAKLLVSGIKLRFKRDIIERLSPLSPR